MQCENIASAITLCHILIPGTLFICCVNQADHSEKPSILNLMSKLVKTVLGKYEYFTLKFKVTWEMFSAVSVKAMKCFNVCTLFVGT